MAVGKGTRKCQHFISTTYILTYMRYLNSVYKFAHRLGWNGVGLNLDYFYNCPRASRALSAVSNPCFLVFEHFYARNIAKTWLRFAIWAFSSLRIQVHFLKAWYSAGFKARKLSFLPLINTIPTSADTLKFLYLSIFCSSPGCTCFGSTYTKIGTIQRRLARMTRKIVKRSTFFDSRVASF